MIGLERVGVFRHGMADWLMDWRETGNNDTYEMMTIYP